MYNSTYDLDGRRNKEKDPETGEMRENPWHKHCKQYATKNNVSYAAAISLAGPSWKEHKEKNGLSFRDRTGEKKKTTSVKQEQDRVRYPAGKFDDRSGERKSQSNPLPPPKRERQRKSKETYKNKNRKREEGKRELEEEGDYDNYDGYYSPREREERRDERRLSSTTPRFIDSPPPRERGPPPKKRQRKKQEESSSGSSLSPPDKGRYRKERERDEEYDNNY